ncbi:hypothetical protein RB195_011703 [Necator americanus]
MSLLNRAATDVVFTKERCDRALYGLQVQPGEPSRYRQCGPNGKVWIVPCVPGAVFDPLIKVCKESPRAAFPSASIRRKSGKSDEDRIPIDTELTPITEEFFFSTRRPKRPRPKTKQQTPAPTSHSTSSTHNSIHRSTTPLPPTITYPSPSPLVASETASTSSRPYSPAFTPPNRRITISPGIKRPKIQSTGIKAGTLTPTSSNTPEIAEPIPVSELQMTTMYPYTYEYTSNPEFRTTASATERTTSAENVVNYKGVTISEDEFLKQLVKIVEAHQMAINKIEEQVEEERRRGSMKTIEGPETSFRKQGGRENSEEEENRNVAFAVEEAEKQRQQEIARLIAERVEKEKEELAWQEEIARQEEEKKRKEEEMRRQQIYAQQLAEMRRIEKEKEWQEEIARQRAEMEKMERERQFEIARHIEETQRQEEMRRLVIEKRRQEEEAKRQREIARQKAEAKKKERERQLEIARRVAAAQKQEEDRMKQLEKARQKAEMQKKEKEKQNEIARQVAERKKEEEEMRRQEAAREKLEMEEKERKRQQEIERQMAEKRKQEEEAKRQEIQRQIVEKRKQEEEAKRQEIQRQIVEKRKQEEEAKRREKELLERLEAERQKKEREGQEEFARQQAEQKQRKEEEEKERLRQKQVEEEERRKEEEERQETQRMIEEEQRRAVEQAVTPGVEDSSSTVTNPRFGTHITGDGGTGGSSTDYYGYNINTDVAKTVMAGVMSTKRGQNIATEAPDLEIIHFTAPPPTVSSPSLEWVTSPHSWRPPPDLQTNVLEWTQTPIPSTGLSELPSTVISGCALSDECVFSYDDDLLCLHPSDASRYLQCTPMIGRRGRWTERMCPPQLVFMAYYGRCGLDAETASQPYTSETFVIPRLPSDPEFVRWQGNKEIQHQVPVQSSYQPVASNISPSYQLPPQITTPSSILRTIEEFPRDLLPPFSYIHNTIPPPHYESDGDANMDLSVINPLFPRVQPYFLMPFGKFRDGIINPDTSLMGSIIKPAIKKIAMDQTETFLDRILADQIANNDKSTKSTTSYMAEDGWRKTA